MVQRFAELMPGQIRAAIAGFVTKLKMEYSDDSKIRDANTEDLMLSVADGIASVPTFQNISAVRNGSTQRYSGNYRSRSPSPGRNYRGRSQSRGRRASFNPRGSLCRLHFKYREKAVRCVDPQNCKFNARSPAGSARQ